MVGRNREVMPDTVRKIIDAYGEKAYLKLFKEGESRPYYWSSQHHPRILDNLYERLVEDETFLMEDVTEKKQLLPVTQEFHKVINRPENLMPIKAIGRAEAYKDLATVGRAWLVYLYNGETVLQDGDTIIVDSGIPAGKIRYRVKIDDSIAGDFDPYTREGFQNETLIQLNLKYLKKQFGTCDGERNAIEKDQVGWFAFKTKRIPKPAPEEPTTEIAGPE